MTDKEIYERIDQIQKRLDRFTSSQAIKVIVHEKRKAWRPFGSDWPIFQIRPELMSAVTKDTIKYCMVILLVLGHGVAIGGGYNNINYEDKVVVRAPVVSAWAPKSIAAEASVADVISRVDSQPAVTNKMVYITPDGVVRTLYCNPGPCTPGSVKKHENISGLQMGVPVTYVFKALNKNMLKKEIDIDALFKQAESLIESQAIIKKDKNWVSAIRIPISQVARARAAYEKKQADGDNSVVTVEDEAFLPGILEDVRPTVCTDYDGAGNCVD